MGLLFQFLRKDHVIDHPDEILENIEVGDESWTFTNISIPNWKSWNTSWHGSCVSLLMDVDMSYTSIAFNLKSKLLFNGLLALLYYIYTPALINPNLGKGAVSALGSFFCLQFLCLASNQVETSWHLRQICLGYVYQISLSKLKTHWDIGHCLCATFWYF